MDKLSALTDTERQALEALTERLHACFGSRLQSVVLFGSKSRGDAGLGSDIDVLVVLADDDPYLRSRVRRLAARVSLEYDLLFSVRAMGRSRWDRLARYRFPLYQAVQSDGIDLTPKVEPPTFTAPRT